MVQDLTNQQDDDGSSIPVSVMIGMTTVSIAMFFGTVIFATLALAARSYLLGDTTSRATGSRSSTFLTSLCHLDDSTAL